MYRDKYYEMITWCNRAHTELKGSSGIFKYIIAVLEKEKPIKPIRETKEVVNHDGVIDITTIYKCKKCNEEIIGFEYSPRYCSECGHALDLSDTKLD